MIEMIHGDCMEIMKQYPDNYFQLSCVDPPYGIGEDGSSNHSRGGGKAKYESRKYKPKKWDIKPSKKYFQELFRVSKNQIIFGANNFVEHIPSSTGWIFWDKERYYSDFSDGELAFTSFNVGAAYYKYCWDGFRQGPTKQSIEKRFHPTQKPVALYKWLLSRYAKPGDRILDTHGGSGSICIACHDLGYDLTWMELDADYYAAAVERYKTHAKQATLFEPDEMRQPVHALFEESPQ